MSTVAAAIPDRRQTAVWSRALLNLGISGLALLALAVAALVADPSRAEQVDLLHVNQPPGLNHIWGLDNLGRDILQRTLAGGRLSLTVATGATALGMLLGTLLGAAAALSGGWRDRILGRLMDFVLALPAIPLLIVLQSMAPRGAATMIVVLGVSRFPEVGRLARAACLGTLGQEYVLAARSAGAGGTAIVVRHLLPQAASVLLVAASLVFANTLIAESTLSFLGLGLPPEQPSWGTMLNNAQQSALGGAWWSAMFPGLAIGVAVASANALGDRLRDRLDPHTRRPHQHVGGA